MEFGNVRLECLSAPPAVVFPNLSIYGYYDIFNDGGLWVAMVTCTGITLVTKSESITRELHLLSPRVLHQKVGAK